MLCFNQLQNYGKTMIKHPRKHRLVFKESSQHKTLNSWNESSQRIVNLYQTHFSVDVEMMKTADLRWSCNSLKIFKVLVVGLSNAHVQNKMVVAWRAFLSCVLYFQICYGLSFWNFSKKTQIFCSLENFEAQVGACYTYLLLTRRIVSTKS